MPPQSRVSRKQQQEERRARVAAAREQARRRRRRANLAVIGGALLVAAVVLALVGATLYHRDHKGTSKAAAAPSASASGLSAGAISPPVPTATTTTRAAAVKATTATTAIAGVVAYSGLKDVTTGTRITYPSAPPVGGPHNATVLNCGIYDSSVPNEYAVTDLAHGAVWITYAPTLPAAQVTALQTLVNSFGPAGSYVTLSPYPGQVSPVVATAWGLQLKLPSAADTRLKAFVTAYREYAKAPVPGGTCAGGIGSPQGTVSANGEPATPTVSPVASSS